MRHAVATLVLLAGLATSLGACDSAGPVADATDPTSATASSGSSGSTSGSPTSSGDSASSASRDRTLDPEAFVKEWVRARNATLEAGEFDGFAELNTKDCRYFRAFRKEVSGILDAGGRIHGGRFLDPRRAEVHEVEIYSERVDFVVDVEFTKAFDRTGKQLVNYPNDPGHLYYLQTHFDGSQWRVTSVGEYPK